ncbi:MAG: nickel pincer cofactor biosynthesis protein LarB [Spirochaetales bacterium]|nr:nickel pincer cofactor biosynthesis protein LarB [Spirochaetales bacterium]
MWKKYISEILQKVKDSHISVEQGYKHIIESVTGELGFAEVDLSRSLRTGYPEVIFCLNKEDEDILKIAQAIRAKNNLVLLTRARESTYRLLSDKFEDIEFYPRSGAITIGAVKEEIGLISVVTAGTSDIPVAEEAFVTAKLMGSKVEKYWDIGVAGIHRLFSKLDKLRKSRVIIAVAGMDGALPGVIAGLTSCPVIAVPTAIGYGTGTGGIAAMLTMLNSCAPGVSVVNIDNGFGAGYIASLINKIGK